MDTPIGEGKEEVIHSITGGSESAPNLVCMPGYGAGAAFYFRNLDAFCAKFRTHAVDWLGTGNSGIIWNSIFFLFPSNLVVHSRSLVLIFL